MYIKCNVYTSLEEDPEFELLIGMYIKCNVYTSIYDKMYRLSKIGMYIKCNVYTSQKAMQAQYYR